MGLAAVLGLAAVFFRVTLLGGTFKPIHPRIRRFFRSTSRNTNVMQRCYGLRAQSARWLESHRHAAWGQHTHRGHMCIRLHTTTHTKALTSPESARQYLAARPALLSQLLGPRLSPTDLTIDELGEGLINHVYKVSHAASGGDERAVLLKYAPPYVKSSRLRLSQVRMGVEAHAMALAYQSCPQHVPDVLHHDQENSVTIMDYLAPPLIKVLEGVHDRGLTYPHLPRALGRLLATIHLRTRKEALTTDEYELNVKEVFANTQIVKLNEQVVLTDPMDPRCKSNHRPRSQDVAEAINAFRSDPVTVSGLGELLHSYRTDKQGLIHNDLHFGNLLASPSHLYCIDWEFATYGPVSFDLGCLVAVHLLAALTLAEQASYRGGRPATPKAVVAAEQIEWLFDGIEQIWTEFVTECTNHEESQAAAALHPPTDAHRVTESQSNSSQHSPASGRGGGSSSEVVCGPAAGNIWHDVHRDAVGFACFAMFRLTAGIHSYPGFERVAEVGAGQEASLRVRVVGLARSLLHLRAGGGAGTPQDVVSLARAHMML